MLANIFIVDDDDRIRVLLKEYLETNGYSIKTYASTAELPLQDAKTADLIVLDVMMKGLDGFSYLDNLRSSGCDTKVLLLTAKADIDDKVKGLAIGANDYIIKPFDPRELLYRIRNALGKLYSKLRLGQQILDIEKGKLLKDDGQESLLSSSELDILRILAKHVNNTVAREEIVKSLYATIGERSIDVQINRLRKKIEPDPNNPKYLRTIRHIGYKITPDEVL